MATFSSRHIGPSVAEQARMLDVIGASSLEELMDQALPAGLAAHEAFQLPPGLSESEALDALARLARMNKPARSMIGQGYYTSLLPPVIQRGILENPAWYTSYTPYQPEISQGRLEAMLNFQTLVTDLTGLPIAGASLLDEASASVEAITLALRASKKQGRVLVDSRVFDSTRDVILNRTEALEIPVEFVDILEGAPEEACEGAAAVLVQYPAGDGNVYPPAVLEAWEKAIHSNGGALIAVADLLALVRLEAPGHWGADIVAGSSARFGLPMGNGGPYAGYIATKEAWQRQIPGRLVGVSRDADGHIAYRLALQTREQHIRREKATSNICTAQALLAVIAGMYAAYHGREGLEGIVDRIHAHTRRLAESLRAGGYLLTERYLDTIEVATERAEEIAREAEEAGILLYLASPTTLRISCDEATSTDDIATLAQIFGVELLDDEQLGSCSLHGQIRTDDILTHPHFTSYHNETAMMRYMRSLADKDYALDRGMIPLGSCTMKLNAAAEMMPITYPGFANVHPLAPKEYRAGYIQLMADIEEWLKELSGYDAITLQPNAGSQGELTGLLAIRGYHHSRGEGNRTLCLIPASAHGTNAASAVLAGFKVKVVKNRPDGSIDTEDLDAILQSDGERVGAMMITYPSTYGIYDDEVREVCTKVHEVGGQVYIDGANFNALVAWVKLADCGGDVSHFNLHKTFAIPHGGGGPGVGPVGVRAHLAPFIPGAPGRPGNGSVASAPAGSASILPIVWAYISMMGAQGLREATSVAVLSANYIANRLGEHYPVLFRGKGGRVAHECIVDVRPLKQQAGISVDDVAKRLIDYGFHAPTMSFPVAGTLMIEPTESEDLTEVERLCDAMIAIAREAEQVAQGVWPPEDNPLVNAPHTAQCLADTWDHPYSRAEAVFPHMSQERIERKYWPPVRRVDGPWGDRHFVCTCPPLESYEE